MTFPMMLRTALALAFAALAIISPSAHADMSVKDDSGASVHLKAPARRIVSLAPHVTESLFAIGAGERLVGTVDYSDYPEAAKRVPRIGGYSRIDLEAVIAKKPDLIIAWQSGNSQPQVEQLKALGLPVYVTQPNTMDDIADQLERFGQLTGSEVAAKKTAGEFRQRLARLRQANADKPRVRVFYQIWKAPLMTVGGPQIISDAIRLCGGENVFGQLSQMAPTVSIEAVLQADPEAIIATGMGDARPEWLSDWEKWTQLTAVRRKNLFHINPDIMQRHTPRLLDGTDQLCRLLDTARSRRTAR